MKLLIKLKSKKGVIKVKLEKILRPSKFNKRSHSVTSRKKKSYLKNNKLPSFSVLRETFLRKTAK